MCVCECVCVFFVKVASVMDICPFWQPATVLCVDCIVILWLNKILLLPQHCLYRVMTERRTIDYLCGMRALGHDFKLPDFSTILHKKSFLVSAALYMRIHVMLLLFYLAYVCRIFIKQS